MERAIVVAARNSDVYARTRAVAKTPLKPPVSAVSKQAPSAAMAHQSVLPDLPHLTRSLPMSGERMAAGIQEKMRWPRGLPSIQAVRVAFSTARRMEGKTSVELEAGAVVVC